VEQIFGLVLSFLPPMHYIQLQFPWIFPTNVFPFYLTGLAHLCERDRLSNGIIHLVIYVELKRRCFEECTSMGSYNNHDYFAQKL